MLSVHGNCALFHKMLLTKTLLQRTTIDELQQIQILLGSGRRQTVNSDQYSVKFLSKIT